MLLYTCQNAALLEITCHGSIMILRRAYCFSEHSEESVSIIWCEACDS